MRPHERLADRQTEADARSELLVVKNGSKMRERISGSHAGPGVFDVHLNAVFGGG